MLKSSSSKPTLPPALSLQLHSCFCIKCKQKVSLGVDSCDETVTFLQLGGPVTQNSTQLRRAKVTSLGVSGKQVVTGFKSVEGKEKIES